MRTVLSFLVFSILPFIVFAQPTTGGPDPYGYIWRNSFDADTSAPQFNWIDITPPIGTEITGLSDDNSVGWINIGFHYPYYWGEFDRVKVGSNGWMAFNNVSNIAHNFPFIPTPGGSGDNFLAPFLTDLTLGSNDTLQPNPGRVYYWTNYKDIFILTYDNVPHWISAPPQWQGSNTFQLIIDSTQKTILFQYANIQAPPFQTGLNFDLSVGIENLTGNFGFMNHSLPDQLPLIDGMPPDTFAIKYWAPDVTTYQVTDVKADWNQQPGNGAEIVLRNNPINMFAQIENSGNQAVTDSFIVWGRLLDKNNTQVLINAETVDSLPLDQEQILNFATPYASADTQTMRFECQIDLPIDQNPSNDILSSEIVVIDTTYPLFTIDYSKGAYTNILSWNGGDAGGGMYYDPPYYPITIAALQFFMVAIDANDGFIAQVILDDDSFGRPGTVVFEDTIEGFNVIPFTWHTVVLPAPVNIDSGGFYMSWLMQGPTPQLGATNSAPISYRTFEILNDTWEVYRDRSFIDFKMRPMIQGGCNVQPTITASGPLQFCDGDTSVILSVGGNFDNFLWSTTETTSTIEVTHSGTYSATVSYLSGCGGATNTVIVEVNDHPTPTLTASSGVLSIDIPGTYEWYRDDTLVNGLTTQQITAPQTGVYNCVVTDSNGCMGNSNSQFVFVNIDTGTAVQVSTIIPIDIFPNPADDAVYIQFRSSDFQAVNFSLRDLKGREMKIVVSEMGKGVFKLETSDLQDGIYSLVVRTNNVEHNMKVQVIH